jgi:hypothetical protein
VVKQNRAKRPGEGEKKTEEKKAAFFVVSPDGLFWGKSFFSVFLNSPCYETPKKRDKKNQ